MRKSIFMFCCVLATSILFTGCEDTEVKVNEPSQELTVDELLKYHYKMHPELAVDNARTQIQSISCQIDFVSYMQNSRFNITTSIANEDCHPNGNKFKVFWYIKKDDGSFLKWFDFPIEMSCLNEADLLSETSVTQKTTKIQCAAIVHNSNNSYFGIGFTNKVVLTRP